MKITTLDKSINNEGKLRKIRAMQPDVMVSILCNVIFRAPLLEVAPCLNLHTSPLPRYRGLMPTFWVLRFGEAEPPCRCFSLTKESTRDRSWCRSP